MVLDAAHPETLTALDLLGVPAVVSCTEPRLTRLVRHLWAPFRTDPDDLAARTPLLQVTFDGVTWQVSGPAGTSTTPAPEQVLSTLATGLNQHALSGTPHFATHAGVVVVGDRCVALVATSGTGKSTLTAALLQLGADYVSDEALCLDTHGGVVPYPRPLGLLPWTRGALGLPARWSAEEETQLSAAELGARALTEAPPLTDVVLLRRGVAGPAALRPTGRQEAAGELLRRSFNHHRDPARAFALVHGAVAASRTWTLDVGPPRSTAQVLVDGLRQPPT